MLFSFKRTRLPLLHGIVFTGFTMLTVGITVIFLITSAILTYYVAKCLRIVFLINKFPGSPMLSLMNIRGLEFNMEREKNLYKYRDECRGLMRHWHGARPCLVVYGAEHLQVLLSEAQNYTSKGKNYKFLEPWLRTGLLTSDGGKWLKRRRLITPAFYFSILQNFMDTFNDESLILVENMKKFADKPDPVNIYPHVTRCALDIICGTAMGVHINSQNDSNIKYVEAISRIRTLVIKRILTPHLWPESIFCRSALAKEHDETVDILHKFTKQIIKERLEETSRQSAGTAVKDELGKRRKKTAFLDLLLQVHREDPSFTLEDIQEEVDTFMFAGHDTSASPTGFAIFLPGQHPEIQARIHEELDEIFGESDRPVTADDLSKMTYLTRVVKEILRFKPPVPIVERRLKRDIILDGKVVPKETFLEFKINLLHQDPQYFPNPERFDPDRFLPENVDKRHPFAYLPFLAGSRNCIGQRFAMMEIKVTAANFFRRYSVESVVPKGRASHIQTTRPRDRTLLVKLTSRREQEEK